MDTSFKYDEGNLQVRGTGAGAAESPLLMKQIRREIQAKGAGKVPGVTGVILAGGASSRMGSNKALLLHSSGRIIEGIYRTLAELFEEVIVVTNTPQLYSFLPCRKVPDLFPGKGVLAGIHSGLTHCSENAAFVVACDMPQLQGDLIRHLTTLAEGVDVVLPQTSGGFEPLHAVYGKGCIPALEKLMENDNQRVLSLLPLVRVRKVASEDVASFDGSFGSFVNINTPDDYYRLRSGGKGGAAEGDVTFHSRRRK